MAIIVDDKDDIAAFADYVPDDAPAAAATPAAPTPPAPEPAAATPAAPTPSTPV